MGRRRKSYFAKSLAYSVGIVAAITVFEQFLTGEGVQWFRRLQKPEILVSIRTFYVIASLLAVFVVVVLSRLFTKYFVDEDDIYAKAIGSVILVLVCNAVWNFFFMGMESTRNGFIGMLILLPVVLASLGFLWKCHDRFSFGLIAVYAVWVVYNIVWTYQLWQLNP